MRLNQRRGDGRRSSGRFGALVLAGALLWALPAVAGDDPLARARGAASQDRFVEAAAAYREALAEAPDDLALLRELARTLSRAERHGEAVETYRQILALSPEDVESRIALGRVLAWMGRFGEAEAELERAVAESDAVDAHLTLGDVRAWQKEFETAAESYEAARARGPRDARPLIRLARLHRWRGDRKGARALLEDALALDPESGEARQALERLEGVGTTRRFRADLGLRHDDVMENRPGWWQQWFYLQMRPADGWLVFGGFDHYRRSGARDDQFTLGGAVRLPSRTWLTGRLTLGPDAEVVARRTFEAELSHPWSERWATHLRYRHSSYAGGIWADITTPGLQFSWSPYARVLAQYYYTRVSDGIDSHSGSLRVTFFPERRINFEVGGAAGKQGFAATSIHQLGTEKDATGLFAGSRIVLTERIGLRLAYEYEKIEDTYRRHGVAAGLSIHF